LHYQKSSFLILQIISMLFFALGIPLSAVVADKYGRARMLLIATACIFLFGLIFAPLFSTGSLLVTAIFLIIGMFLMGLTYGPVGTALAEIFPASVRYTGASLAFNLAGILGASLTPLLATTLAKNYGLEYVGYYLCAVSVITFLALVASRAGMRDSSDKV